MTTDAIEAEMSEQYSIGNRRVGPALSQGLNGESPALAVKNAANRSKIYSIANQSWTTIPPVPHWLDSLMHPNLGDVPTWLAAIIAMYAAYLSWKSSRESKQARKDAETQAETARMQAASAERAALAAEKGTALAIQQADAAEKAPWTIVSRNDGNSDHFFLRNETHTKKYNVSLSGTPTTSHLIVNSFLGLLGKYGKVAQTNTFDVVDGRSPVGIDLDSKSIDRAVIVNWHPTQDDTGDPLTQRIDI